MKNNQFYAILGTIWLAPISTSSDWNVNMLLGAVFTVLSIVWLIAEKDYGN